MGCFVQPFNPPANGGGIEFNVITSESYSRPASGGTYQRKTIYNTIQDFLDAIKDYKAIFTVSYTDWSGNVHQFTRQEIVNSIEIQALTNNAVSKNQYTFPFGLRNTCDIIRATLLTCQEQTKTISSQITLDETNERTSFYIATDKSIAIEISPQYASSTVTWALIGMNY